MMADDRTLTTLLTKLDGIANSPSTAYQREIRAQGLLAEAGLSVADIVKGMLRYNLSWNQQKAQECGVSIEIWLQAARIVKQSPGETLGDLLDRIHQMESVAAMLRAGYVSGRDTHGRLVWTR